MLVFSTPTYGAVADAACEHETLERGSLETRLFPDGERYWRIKSACEDRDVALIGGTISEVETLAVYDIACGLVGEGARSVTMVIPYFGYQTMERAVRPGEVVTAKTRAQLLSSIPVASAGNRVVLVDVHAAGIPYYFDPHVRPVHMDASPVIHELIRRLGGEDFVLAATDAGRAKWVERLANQLGVEAAFVFKRRLAADQTEGTAMSADVRGRHVVIYDDIIRTGSSLLGAARAYREAGATAIAAVATHGVFPGDALERLQASGLLDRIACTDTHPRACQLATDGFLEVGSLAAPIAALLAAQHT